MNIPVTIQSLAGMIAGSKRQGFTEGLAAALDLIHNRATNSGDMRLYDLVDAVKAMPNPYAVQRCADG